MTVDVQFGTLYQDTDSVGWPEKGYDWQTKVVIGKEDDGTNPEFTIYSGQPYRSFPIGGFYGWIDSVPEARQMFLLCKPEYPETQDREYRKVDKELLDVINSLPKEGNPIDVDRVKWFKYWSKRAVEEFGENAYIQFS